MTSFHLIIAVAALLTTLGLIMVLSASGCGPMTTTDRHG
ncbi:putative membrane protein [Mycobacterium ulcerans str. Harvey]|uniref:Membrane protein n=1 Tax=Mycobacterium ulcerans str. Harvey TaxID=1299332 RepID=A0ABP3A927_MYCUL|nr:putative membrane protein [Mycobacterium ulcerans str. Harvey]